MWFLKVRKSDGYIKCYGLQSNWKDDDTWITKTVPDTVTMTGLNDAERRRKIKWDMGKDILVEVPEAERVAVKTALQTEWEGMKAKSTTSDQIAFLAKRLGLE